jgi:hypothetical protein
MRKEYKILNIEFPILNVEVECQIQDYELKTQNLKLKTANWSPFCGVGLFTVFSFTLMLWIHLRI